MPSCSVEKYPLPAGAGRCTPLLGAPEAAVADIADGPCDVAAGVCVLMGVVLFDPGAVRVPFAPLVATLVAFCCC